MNPTLRELAQQALNVQDACNLSGVAHGFAKAMTHLWPHCKGTTEVNTHPIAILWADKIAHLTGTQNYSCAAISAAYREVQKLARGET